ncbi:Cytochrome c oxidase polypeptide II [Sulfitobacter noctilucae]|uniref:cytochrome c oxidase subunit II n=1 Tax=Sulfitobacter noctilucae TaxID=1342302 RepID=UPI000AA3BEE2|nr:cytochrome B [Sulfitobacter noctilucae]KIN70576.1 Cytochrome c oxidase polypeptide II [Sulfitobacter noctilucae]
MLDPAGPAAREIATLWWIMLGGSFAILVFVTILLALSFRPDRRQHDDVRMERTWIVGLGLGFSVAVLAALLSYGVATGARLTAPSETPVQVTAKATLAGWTFGYDARDDTEDVLHIPARRDVEVAITTGDIIHSFWVPRLAGKIDAIPGHVNRLRIEADTPGVYQGRSAEYSGPGYLDLRFTVQAHDADGWQEFLRGETE